MRAHPVRRLDDLPRWESSTRHRMPGRYYTLEPPGRADCMAGKIQILIHDKGTYPSDAHEPSFTFPQNSQAHLRHSGSLVAISRNSATAMTLRVSGPAPRLTDRRQLDQCHKPTRAHGPWRLRSRASFPRWRRFHVCAQRDQSKAAGRYESSKYTVRSTKAQRLEASTATRSGPMTHLGF
jgi:hypothetical protein